MGAAESAGAVASCFSDRSQLVCGDRSQACCGERSQTQRKLVQLSLCNLPFEQPARPLGQSGNGVRFYSLVRASVPAVTGAGAGVGAARGNAKAVDSRSQTCLAESLTFVEQWLGKDVSNSLDELEFYHLASKLRDQKKWRILRYLANFQGVSRGVKCASLGDADETRELDLLIFRSPLEGLARPRLLALELGPRSAVAHKGKIATRLDGVVLARREGPRVEGFLAPPKTIAAEDPTFDSKGWTWGDSSQRRAKRLPLLRLSLADALSALVDLRDPISEERLWTADPAKGRAMMSQLDSFSAEFLGPAEYAELALITLVRELAALFRACVDVPLPQQWLSTSLGLLVEAGAAPPRVGSISPELWVASRVKLHLANWGKSRITELFPEDSMYSFGPPTAEYQELWNLYSDGLAWLLWEASRLYYHGYCSEVWTDLTVELYEFGVKGDDVLLGLADTKLSPQDPGPRTVELIDPTTCQPAKGLDGSPATVTLCSAFVPCPVLSRLSGVWLVRLIGATVQPQMELPEEAKCNRGARRPDPTRPPSSLYAVVSTQDGPGQHVGKRSTQRSKTVPATAEPLWQDEFEFAVITGDATIDLCKALGCTVDAWQQGQSWNHLPPASQRPPRQPDADEVLRTTSARQMCFIEMLRRAWSVNACNSAGHLGCKATEDMHCSS